MSISARSVVTTAISRRRSDGSSGLPQAAWTASHSRRIVWSPATKSAGARSRPCSRTGVPATKRPTTKMPLVMIPAETAVGDMPSAPSSHNTARSATRIATTATVCPASLRFPNSLRGIARSPIYRSLRAKRTDTSFSREAAEEELTAELARIPDLTEALREARCPRARARRLRFRWLIRPSQPTRVDELPAVVIAGREEGAVAPNGPPQS